MKIVAIRERAERFYTVLWEPIKAFWNERKLLGKFVIALDLQLSQYNKKNTHTVG